VRQLRQQQQQPQQQSQQQQQHWQQPRRPDAAGFESKPSARGVSRQLGVWCWVLGVIWGCGLGGISCVPYMMCQEAGYVLEGVGVGGGWGGMSGV
jgi:hypothetical protein